MAQLKQLKQIKTIKVAGLRNWVENPRFIKDARYKELLERIRRDGFNDVLKLAADGQTVIGGNMRLRALKELGFSEVQVIYTEAKTPEDIFRVAMDDNEAFGEYDRQQLVELAYKLDIPAIELQNYQVYLSQPQSLGDLVEQDTQELVEDEAPPVADVAVSKLGEIYQLGRHRLMCGDSTDFGQVSDLMDGVRAAINFTSPPYNAGDTVEIGPKKKKYNQYDDKATPDQWRSLIRSSIDVAMQTSDYQFYNIQQLAGNKIAFIELLHELRDRFVDMAIWDKNTGTPALPNNVMNCAFEYICIFTEGNNPTRTINTGDFHGSVNNIYHGQGQHKNEFADIHSATYPVDFPAYFIKNFTKLGAVVLDNFGGSGSTLIACEQLDRTCYMMELDPKYCDVIRKRYWKFINDGNEEGWEENTKAINEAANVA